MRSKGGQYISKSALDFFLKPLVVYHALTDGTDRYKMDGKETTVAYLPKGCRKVRVEVFPYHVDRIVNSRARKPVIPLDAEILAIGVGPTFLESYKKKYKVK